TIDDDLDALADAYLEIDRLPQAEETYNSALEIRLKFKATNGERWKSYAKLGDMFANQIKDLDYAQHHTEEKYSGAYKKAVDYYHMLVGFYESSPNQSQVNYLDGLRMLGSLYATDPSTYPVAEH